MPHPYPAVDVWSVAGTFQHLIYSPKGAIEGVMIDTEGVPTQFVTDPHDPTLATLFDGLRAGQSLVIEGTEAAPSPKGASMHTVYRFERLAEVDGRSTGGTLRSRDGTRGTVVRFNHARHGEPNGVVLDNGDFVHTRPEGLKRLGLQVGDAVHAQGLARTLVDGTGRVIEAVRVNGRAVGPAH